ncbi:hypothetical protein OQA88_11422 [Cercophora sp. LCS_1]
MLSNALWALAAASLFQDTTALSHGRHQQLHEKRAVVTEVVTETSWTTVTLYGNPSANVGAKTFYTKKGKRPSRTSRTSVLSTSSAPVVEAIPTTLATQTKETESLVTAEARPPVYVPPAEPAPAPAPAPEPAPAEPAPAEPAPATPSNGGRGLAFNDPNLLGRFLNSGSKITWTYNWGQTDDSKQSVEFVPMLWGMSKGFPATWKANAQKMIDAGAKCLFSFNEPDNDGQANITPEVAAAGHIELMNPFAGKALIGSPSITNSGHPDEGVRWLQRWVDVCDGKCAFDFVNIHIYGFDTETFLQHLINVNKQFNKPVWITEFAFGGSDEEINRQLAHVIDQIENNPTYSFVHRYSYFMAAEGMMVKGNSMSSYGNTFAYAS